MSNLAKYKSTYYYKELIKKHSLTETGLWRVLGEDPNCDLGGPHVQPDLGVFEGTLQEVVEMAVKMPGFYTWGAGGDIRRVEIKKVTDLAYERVDKLITEILDKVKELGQYQCSGCNKNDICRTPKCLNNKIRNLKDAVNSL